MSAEDDETDSLVRAVAAAPAQLPPAHLITAMAVCLPDRSLVERAHAFARSRGLALTDRAQDGLVATFAAGDGAVDAASCALAMRDALSSARIVVVTAPAELAALEHAAALMKAARAGDIQIDRVTGNLLDAGFDVREDSSGWTLVGKRAAANHARELVDTDSLALVRWGMRFSDAGVEADYRAWYVPQSLPMIRAAGLISILFIVLGIILFGFVSPRTWAAAATTGLCAILVTAALIACSYQRRFMAWILPLTALTALMIGCTNVVTYSWFVDDAPSPGMATFAAWISILLISALFRLKPGLNSVAIVPFVVFLQIISTHRFLVGRLDALQMATYSSSLWVTVVFGTIVSVTLDRDSRRSYRRGRVIEMQRQVIDRLQKAELERQVAEGARGPAEAIARLADIPARLAPGDRVDGRYRVARTIGAGAMGQVHEVERLTDGQRLALKTITRSCDRTSLARFAREGQIAAALDHPNVVPVLDLGVTQSGTLYLVMELVAGSSLAAARARYGDERWALPVLLQIAEALAAMHARGIVHRDLKPSNILLDGARVKVADFGIAGLIDSTLAGEADTLDPDSPLASTPDLTRTDAIMGTPRYMAPELARGARSAGPSADVFGFGVVAYELLSNQVPFTVSPALERLHGRAAPVAMPIAQARADLARELTTLVDACLLETPEARPSAQAIAVAIGRMIS